MPESSQSRSVELFIVDIFLADFRINEYLKDVVDAEHLRQDSMRWDATIRQLEIVGEAIRNILKDDMLSAVAPSYFRKVVNFRNTITHGYFGIDADEVLSVINRHLPVLMDDLRTLVSTAKLDIKRAIKSEATDLERIGDQRTAHYLRHLFP